MCKKIVWYSSEHLLQELFIFSIKSATKIADQPPPPTPKKNNKQTNNNKSEKAEKVHDSVMWNELEGSE